MSTRTTLAALAIVTSAYSAQAATVISLSDFDNAIVEDFNTAPLGLTRLAGPMFSDLGITDISASYNRDKYNARANSSRALGVGANGNVSVIDTGTRGLSSSYTLSFAAAITQFGFGIHDQRTRLTLKFSNNGTVVDTLRVRTGTRDLAQFYVQAAAFDEITISARKTKQAFALDNLTVEGPAVVPVPAGFPLFITALGALAWVRRKAKV